MSKHIVDTARASSGSAKFAHYARIDLTERPHPHTKLLQERPLQTDPDSRTKRFLGIARRKAQ